MHPKVNEKWQQLKKPGIDTFEIRNIHHLVGIASLALPSSQLNSTHIHNRMMDGHIDCHRTCVHQILYQY